MTDLQPSPRPRRRVRGSLAAAVLVVAGSSSACGDADPTSVQTSHATWGQATGPVPYGAPEGLVHLPGELGAAFGDGGSTVDNLDRDLLEAVRAAARDAGADGVRLAITSGWRSRAHQQRLFDEAVRTYGSEEEALRYVATPDTSRHVTGDAVDIGPTEADDWLRQHGADYGLCQVFANEIWHFELATSPGGRCPELLPDSSYRN